MGKTIEVTSCLTCPFYREREVECVHDDGPSDRAVMRARGRGLGAPTVAEGCPLASGPTLVQIRVEVA